MKKSSLRLWFVALIGSFTAGAFADEPIVFNRDIRPILSDNCFFCHGPDRNKREADLRLDTLEGLHGKEGSPGALIPGKPDESQLVHRITSADPDEKMPPAHSGKSLKPAEIDLIRRWIAQGGEFEGHWSFLPRKSSSSLVDDKAATARIDELVAEQRERQKLPAASPADKITLLRRLYFDLTGLPPSEEEVAKFMADESPQAYEALVDRLLASPHYGERMAMWWLDLVRYADTVGYHGDQNMSVSPFRDYIVDSFNSNKRFDEFTLEQLAGDLIPNASREQLIASGYNRLGMMSAEGGGQDKEYLAKYMSERVRNASGTWLGVTLGCAECHDHKFDPLTTKDFYRFGAFFADIKERGIYAGANDDGNWGSYIKDPTPEQEAERARLASSISAVRKLLETPTPELAAAQAEWEQKQIPWTFLKPVSAISKEGAALTIKEDASVLASGKNPATDTYTLTFKNLPENVTALRLEVLPDDSLPSKGPGRAGNGNFVLSTFTAEVKPASGELAKIALQNATATFEQPEDSGRHPFKKFAIASVISADPPTEIWGWAIAGQTGRPQAAVFETASDLKIGAEDSLTITLAQNFNNPHHTLGRFRLSVTTAPRPVRAADSVPPQIAQILAVAAASRTEAQANELAAYYRGIAPLLEPKRLEVAELEKQQKAFEATITSSLITERVEPRMVRVLARGNWMDDKGEVVTPAFPSLLADAPPEDQRLTRLDLAKWIVKPDHPLTSRVLANRLWKILFGAGLSRRLDDLGAQGEWPSHPELIDELAQWMVDSNWDLKRWLKIVVMSKTYQQASVASPEVREKDPANRWLARQSRFRLDAEMVRDNALAISGLLVEKVGGKSVHPYQPPGYFAYLNFPAREWQNDSGEGLYRRGLYTHWQRQYLHPSLLVFDAPSREECTADRPRSNTPLQSLALLNDPTYVEAARVFAEKILRHEGDDQQKLDFAFRRALSRSISEAESKILLTLLESQRAEYTAKPETAKEVLSNGAYAAPADLDPIQLASWTTIARALLNLHETITRY
jgi:hypothetical protein